MLQNKNNTFKKENKPWLDLDCRFARQSYRKLMKRFKRSTSPQNLSAMIDAEKHYKHTLDRKYKNYPKEIF
jgi:transposase